MPTAQSVATPLIPRRILFGNPERTAARVSPDGTRLAYLAPKDGVLNVWVRSLERDDSRPVTADTERPIRAFFWRPDGSGIIHLQDRAGDENFHVYLTDLADGTTRDLTPYDGARADILAVERSRPDELLVTINARDPRVFDVYHVDLRKGTAECVVENPGDVAGWGTDNDLNVRIAHVVRPSGGTQIRVRETGGEWRVFLEADHEETLEAHGFDERGRLLIGSSLNVNATRLLAYDLATGASEVLAEDPTFDVTGPLTNPNTHEIEAIAFERERMTWTNVTAAVSADFAAIEKLCDGDWTLTSRDRADTKWIVQYTVDDGPGRYYLFDRSSRDGTFLFTTQPALEQFPLAKMEPVRFTARDGLQLYGYLSLPPGRAEGERLPMVLNVHGGPWHRDSWGYRADVQWLTNRGYGVLQVNFRGSTGFGKEHLNAGDLAWGAEMHDDLLDARQWAIDQGYADPARFAIFGGSYGGYAVLAALAFTPDVFTCGVDIVGPSNLQTLIASIPPYWEPLLAQFKRRVGDPDTQADFLVERSPLTRADAITRPLLIAQGANDPRVKIAESDQIVGAMRAKGLQVEYLVFDDEGHGFARPENRMRFYSAMEAFLAQHLGGISEPATPEESVAAMTR